MGGISAILLWLVSTCLIWRETKEERSSRLKGASSQTIACPNCGYNLTGLRATMCPECGTTYTIDELLSAQPAMEASEIESESSRDEVISPVETSQFTPPPRDVSATTPE